MKVDAQHIYRVHNEEQLFECIRKFTEKGLFFVQSRTIEDTDYYYSFLAQELKQAYVNYYLLMQSSLTEGGFVIVTDPSPIHHHEQTGPRRNSIVEYIMDTPAIMNRLAQPAQLPNL